MESISVVGQCLQRTVLTEDLFSDFCSYVDRCPKTIRTYAVNLRQLFAWLRYKDIQQPQNNDIRQFRDWLLSEHDGIIYDPDTVSGWKYSKDRNGNINRIACKPATVRAYMQSCKQFFRWTASRQIYPDIAKDIHVPAVSSAHRKDSLDPDQVAAVEQSIIANAAGFPEEQKLRLLAMFLLAANTGMRTIEISRARIKDIDSRNGHTCIYIWGKGRNEADQKKPISHGVAAAIDNYLSVRTDHRTGNSPLFVSTGNRSGGKAIAVTTISSMLKGALQAAGYDSERLTAHSLRHTAAQNVLDMTGGNIYRTQNYMRHQSPHTTEIYLDKNTETQDAALASQLWNRYHNTNEITGIDKLHQLTEGMTESQIAALIAVAEKMQSKI